MGFSPREVDALAPWEFAAMTRAWAKGNGAGPRREISDDRLAALGIEGFEQ